MGGDIVDDNSGGTRLYGAVGRLTVGSGDDPKINDGGLCTATLIAPTTAISAQHCLPFKNGQWLPNRGADDIWINFGTLHWEGGVWARVKTVTESDENYGRHNDSIMLLHLDRSISGVTPIRVAGPNDGRLWNKDRPMIAMGWGTIDDYGTRSAELRRADVEIADPSVTGFQSDLGGQTHGMLRTRDLEQGHTNPGDSGGPLLTFDENNQPVVVGVLWGGVSGLIYWKDKSHYMKTGVDPLFGGKRK